MKEEFNVSNKIMVMGMERYISMASHISDEMKQEEELCGKANIDDAFDSLVHLVGPEVTARLKEYRITAEINREINDMPEDTRNKLIDIIDNVMVPLSKRKVPAEEFRDTLLTPSQTQVYWKQRT